MSTNRKGSVSPPDRVPALAAGPPSAEPAAKLPAGALSFAPVPLRYRHDGFTPDRQRAFIEELAETLSPPLAAARVGISVQSAYRLRRHAGADGFSAAWDAAMRRGVRDKVRETAVDLAVNGRLVRRFYHGQLLSEERVHSERLIVKLLDKGDKLFADASPESERILADWDGSMDRLERGDLEGGWRVWRDRRGNRITNFPPPDGFCGHAEGEPGEPGYFRRLTQSEEDALDAALEPRVEQGEAARDRFFGFKPGRRACDRQVRL